MDEHLRELERRAAAGDPEAAELLVCHRIRSGQKRIIHNWIDHEDMPREDYDIEVYLRDDDAWGFRIDVTIFHYDESFPTEFEALIYARKLVHVCPACMTQLRYANDDSKQPIVVCCHCRRNEYENFEECQWCDKVLCTSEACIPCERIEGFKEIGYPDLYQGKRVIWIGSPGGRSEYCGTCATDLTRSEGKEFDIYHAVSTAYLFRCHCCGQWLYPDPNIEYEGPSKRLF